ncbi:hypothetical protein HD598_002475 [Neomicrococcus aestuarii]|uniref:PAC2 family protein n=1 Tax=Neomicrococcus aestuarii TaxID=556325 RepID=A0A7W8TVW0_9MICC|nr:PAC2 family protein [Neomicrococcus aestuarii]MBB5513788.1 hypothetical protein [Neomicrococcus aestuarii]
MDPMDLVEVDEQVAQSVRGHNLDMLVLLDGHMDAGQALAQVRDTLLEELPTRTVAIFDADSLIDHSAKRPRIMFDNGHFVDYAPHRIAIDAATDGLGRDFLILSGPEPSLHWERFTSAMTWLNNNLGVNRTAFLASVPMPVPHTRPITGTVHGNSSAPDGGAPQWPTPMVVPASLANVLEASFEAAGKPTIGFTMHVPHYLSDGQYPNAAIGGLEYMGAALGLALPTDELREQGREVEAKVAEQVASNPEIQSMVRNIEEQYDAHREGLHPQSLLLEGGEVPDGESLAAAASEFLRLELEDRNADSAPEHDDDASR